MAKVGRPTKYKRKFCDEIIEFFDVAPWEMREVATHLRNGSTVIKDERYPSRFPTMERFAHNIGVHVDTMIEWTTKYPQFSEAYKRAQQLQKDLLVENGLQGAYQSNFAIFVAQNFTDMRDKKDIKLGGDLNVALVEFVGDDPDEQNQNTNT